MEKWKQYNGSKATYRNLIGAFERAGHQDFADNVCKIAGQCFDTNINIIMGSMYISRITKVVYAELLSYWMMTLRIILLLLIHRSIID